jgi:hypothetical protein
VKVPDEVIIRTISNEFCICWFKDLTYGPESLPHFYVCIPIKQKYSLLLCIITKQIQNKRKYYSKNIKALSALVEVSYNDLYILDREYNSVVDCNHAELFTIDELIERIDPEHGIEIKMGKKEIPHYLKIKIIKAIKLSPVVRPHYKKLLL